MQIWNFKLWHSLHFRNFWASFTVKSLKRHAFLLPASTVFFSIWSLTTICFLSIWYTWDKDINHGGLNTIQLLVVEMRFQDSIQFGFCSDIKRNFLAVHIETPALTSNINTTVIATAVNGVFCKTFYRIEYEHTHTHTYTERRVLLLWLFVRHNHLNVRKCICFILTLFIQINHFDFFYFLFASHNFTACWFSLVY